MNMTTPEDLRVVKVSDLDENFLTCDICIDRFRRAKNLPCGHTFCQECLEKWAETNRGRELTCFTCRKLWQVPYGGVEKLPANYYMNSLVEFVFTKNLTGASGAVTGPIESSENSCEFCESKEATSACTECQQLTCDTCAKGHKRTKVTESHQVVSLEVYRANYENQPAKWKPIRCDQHPENQLKFYCQTCSIPICTECTVIKHRIPEHRHVYLSEAADEARAAMNETLAKVTGKLEYYDESEANIRLVKQRLTDSKEQAIFRAEHHTEDLVRLIRKNGVEFIDSITDTYDAKAKVLDSQLGRIELAKGQVKSSFEYSKTMVELGTDASLLLVHKQTQEMLEGLLIQEIQVDPQVNHHLQYSPDPAFAIDKQGIVSDNKAVACKSVVIIEHPTYKKVECQLLGRDTHGNQVKQGGAEVTAQVVTEEGVLVAGEVTDNRDGSYRIAFAPRLGPQSLTVSLFGQPVRGSPFKIVPLLPLQTTSLIGSKGDGPGQFNTPSRVAVSKAGDLFVVDGENARIQVFDAAGRYQRHFAVDCPGGRGKPRSLAFAGDDRLVVTCVDESQVFICDLEGRPVRQFGRGCLSKPWGVAVSSQGHIHVVDWDQHCLKTFTSKGRLIRTVGRQGDQPGQFELPCEVAVNSRDQVIVCDWGNDRMQVFDLQGDFLFTFGWEGESEGELRLPSGVAVDQYDNVVVCDWSNNRLQMFSREGRYIGRVDDPADRVKCPYGVTTVPGHLLKLVLIELNTTSENHCKLRIMQK